MSLDRHWELRISKDGVSKYVTDIKGFPIVMEFGSAADCQPMWFVSQAEAEIWWSLYQKSKPADATGWTAYFEEVIHHGE